MAPIQCVRLMIAGGSRLSYCPYLFILRIAYAIRQLEIVVVRVVVAH